MLKLSHPDIDLLIIVLTVAPCIYYGIKEGIRKGMQRKKKAFKPALHPMRRDGDKYAWYFFMAYSYVGPDSWVYRLPWIGPLPTGILATIALKLVIAKGEQYDYARRKKAKVS